jgi:hypothetical protein
MDSLGDTTWTAPSSGIAGWSLSGTNVYTTTSSNNVGIGVSTPSAALQVNGGIIASGSGNSYFSSGNLGVGSTNPGQMLDVQGTVRDLGEILTSNVPAVTTNELYNNSGSLYFNGSAVGGGSNYWLLNSGVGIGTYAAVGIGTTTPQGGLVVTNGNVGIGTWTSSAALLSVQGNVGIGSSIVDLSGSARVTITGSEVDINLQ